MRFQAGQPASLWVEAELKKGQADAVVGLQRPSLNTTLTFEKGLSSSHAKIRGKCTFSYNNMYEYVYIKYS